MQGIFADSCTMAADERRRQTTPFPLKAGLIEQLYGVFNVYEDSDDEDAYMGEQKELQQEMQELLVAKHWINQKGWDVASEAQVVSPSSGKTIDLRLDWAMVERKLKQGYGDLAVSDAGDVDEVKVLSASLLISLIPPSECLQIAS